MRLASDGLVRSTVAVSGLNLASRASGLLRVMAMSAALGATALGDTYQAANLSSNILFELLAGGVLSAALVPSFVELVDAGERQEAVRLAGIVLGLALAVLGVAMFAGMLMAGRLMELLTLGVADGEVRAGQVGLGTFFLWFILPQVLLYATGAVATALLHAERRFVAAALAPVLNNLVVIVSMLVFWSLRNGETSLALSTAEKTVLAGGATLGVVAMVSAPLGAAWRGGLRLRPRWRPREPRVRPLLARGGWAAGQVAVTQLLAVATLVVAGAVDGGVVAYQVAFTFFLLPYALLANPVATTMFPLLSARAARGDLVALGEELSRGLRTLSFFLIPASSVLAVLARPLVESLRLGNLDSGGAEMVATALAAYLVGLLGYSALALLARCYYALGDTRTPTTVSLVCTLAGVVGILAGSRLTSGRGILVLLGLAHAAVVTVAAAVLLWRLRRRVRSVLFAKGLWRDLIFGAAAGAVAWQVGSRIGFETRADAVAALSGGGAAAFAGYLGAQLLTGRREFGALARRVRAQ